MIGLPFPFDFKKPDYHAVWAWRVKLLAKIRENPETLDAFKAYYAEHLTEFLCHWGTTFDPRNSAEGKPNLIPFVLFERQIEFCEWLLEHWRNGDNGVAPKSRDMGISWLTISLSCAACLFIRDISVGFGSRKEEYVDKKGDPKSIFWKGAFFVDKLPREFKGSWDIKQHAPHMRLLFPETNSSITGEAGDNIGRGDRKSFYIVDESAHLLHPELAESSLSATTNCRIDVSSVNGTNNPFAIKARNYAPNHVFVFHWRSNPMKTQEWYDKLKEKYDDVVIAQEYDIDYAASVAGVVIPSGWVQAAIDAAAKLKIEVTGSIEAALDIADQGKDINAAAVRKGVELIGAAGWSGKDGDTFQTTQRAFDMADEYDCQTWQYDADGMGALVRGDSRVINEQRVEKRQTQIKFIQFRGSGQVLNPEKEVTSFKGRKNKDYFVNRKAQAWWLLRLKFQTTFRAIKALHENTVYKYDPDEIISLRSDLPDLSKIVMELSQPTYAQNYAGKLLIDKAPDGARSPNFADAVMMVYAPRKFGLFS